MQQDDPRNMFFTQRQEYEEDLTHQTNTTTQNRTEPPKGQTTQNGNTTPPKGNGVNADYEQKLAEMKKLAAKYEREGEGQLVKDILNNVLEQKAAGKLSNEQLIAFVKRISPLLNAEQRTRLNGLLEQLLKL